MKQEELEIKLTEPAYRPFNTKEECWGEMLKHQPFGWVQNKENKEYKDVTLGRCPDNYGINGFEYTKIFDNFIFADGTPFGIKEE